MLTPRLRGLARARTAVAGIEFAVMLPLLLTMLFGTTDLALAIITVSRLTTAAGDVTLIASTMAVQTSNLNALTGQQAWQATTAPFAVFPAWRGPGQTFSITLSAVDFTADGTGFRAETRWSVGNPKGQTVLRPCGVLPAVPNGSAPSMAALPAGAFGPTSILVGDVSTVFVPLFTAAFVGPVAFQRSAYVSPRVNNGVTLVGAGPAKTVSCPKQGS